MAHLHYPDPYDYKGEGKIRRNSYLGRQQFDCGWAQTDAVFGFEPPKYMIDLPSGADACLRADG